MEKYYFDFEIGERGYVIIKEIFKTTIDENGIERRYYYNGDTLFVNVIDEKSVLALRNLGFEEKTNPKYYSNDVGIWPPRSVGGGFTVWFGGSQMTYSANGYYNGFEIPLYSNDPNHLTVPGALGKFWDDPLWPLRDDTPLPDYPGKPSIPPGFTGPMQCGDPLAFDLDGDGKVETINVNDSNVFINMDGDNFKEATGWINSKDGLLFFDKNNNNEFDGLSELFGSKSKNGFEELKGYDGNNDGKIDNHDSVYSKLQIWQDKNSNGKIDSGELLSLSNLGIDSISLNYSDVNIQNNGNNLNSIGSYTKGNDKHFIGSFDLTYDNIRTIYEGETTHNVDGIRYLPVIYGFGDVADLHIACALDESFKNYVFKTVFSSNVININEFMYKWTGLDKLHNANGVVKNGLSIADKLWILEKFTGNYQMSPQIEHNGMTTTSRRIGDVLLNKVSINNSYKKLTDYYSLRFLAFTTTCSGIAGVKYDIINDRVSFGTNFINNLLEHNTILTKNILSMLYSSGLLFYAKGTYYVFSSESNISNYRAIDSDQTNIIDTYINRTPEYSILAQHALNVSGLEDPFGEEEPEDGDDVPCNGAPDGPADGVGGCCLGRSFSA